MPIRAFTLIELLIVLAIILVLVGLGFGAYQAIADSSRALVTKTRIEELLRALAEGGHTRELVPAHASAGGEASPAQVLHRLLRQRSATCAPGVVDFMVDTRFGVWTDASYDPARVAAGTWTWTGYPWQTGPYPTTEGHRFAFPWGAEPTDDPTFSATAPPPVTASFAIEERGLSQLCPQLSPDLVQAAGLLPEDDLGAYRGDRSRKRAWNDGWGRPLVVAFGLYQPPRNALVVTREWYDINPNDWTASAKMAQSVTRQDYFLKRALKTYGHHRSLYLSAGALGPVLPADLAETDLVEADPAAWSATGGPLDRAWRTINGIAGVEQPVLTGQVVAMPAPEAELWRTAATPNPPRNPFTAAPWTGIRTGRTGGLRCWLSAPKEVR